jgi:Protein of unknown function (DUF3689)
VHRNTEVLGQLILCLDEERFRQLMSTATMHLVDSNVFLRSSVMSLERLAPTRPGALTLFMKSDIESGFSLVLDSSSEGNDNAILHYFLAGT